MTVKIFHVSKVVKKFLQMNIFMTEIVNIAFNDTKGWFIWKCQLKLIERYLNH